MTPPDAKPIVEELGGPAHVARLLKSKHSRGHLTRSAVCLWKIIPEQHCEDIADMSGGKYTPPVLRPDLEWVSVNGKFYTRPREAA